MLTTESDHYVPGKAFPWLDNLKDHFKNLESVCQGRPGVLFCCGGALALAEGISKKILKISIQLTSYPQTLSRILRFSGALEFQF